MKPRGYAAIGLHRPKNSLNMGEIMRAAGCYGAAMVAVAGARFRQAPTDTQRSWRHIPVIEVPEILQALPFGCTPVAVEFIDTAQPLPGFVHPERAFYIFGPEDGSLPPEVLRRCAATVFLPTAHCLNLAVTAGTVLYDRCMKQAHSGEARRRA